MSAVSSTSELTTKEIVEQAISDYHESILPYLNGQVPVIANKFDKANLYSTDEKIIGRWIDGKPLYQKTIELSPALRFLLNGTWQNICDTPSTNLERLVDIKFNAFNNVAGFDAGISNINIVFYDSTTQKIKGWNINGGSDYIEIKNITIQYTKKTDEAIAIGSDTDYSTTEKIVGTWIDGKPLYQKTFEFDSPVNLIAGDWGATNIPIGNIDKIIHSVGYSNSTTSWEGLSATVDIGSYVNLIFFRDIKVFKVTLQYTKTTD